MTSGPRRRAVLALLVAAVLGGSLAGCTSTPEHDDLVVLAGRDDSAGGQRQRLVDAWNFVHPDKPARVVELSGLADQQHNALVEDAQDPSSGADVYGLDVTWTAEFAERGYIEALDDVDESDFLVGPLATAHEGGTLYAVPYNTDAGLLFYRSDLVPRPTSWADLQGDTERLGAGPAAVWAGQLAPYEGLTVNVLESRRSLDTRQLDLFDDPGQQLLNRAVDQLRPHPEDRPPVVLGQALNFDEDASLQAFQQGRVAVLRDWPVAYGVLTQPSAEDPAAGSTVGVTQLPAGGAVLGGTNLAVSSHSTRRDDAQELIRFLTDTSAQRQLFDDGGVAPTRMSTYSTSRRAGEPIVGEVLRAVTAATPRPSGPCYGAFSALFSAEIHASLVAGTPVPADLLERSERALDCRPPR
jgi:multiple sugar transport system substrate-binding protein